MRRDVGRGAGGWGLGCAHLAVTRRRREAFFRAYFNLPKEGPRMRWQLAQVVALRPIHVGRWQYGVIPIEYDHGAGVVVVVVIIIRWWWGHHRLICRRLDGLGIYYGHDGDM